MDIQKKLPRRSSFVSGILETQDPFKRTHADEFRVSKIKNQGKMVRVDAPKAPKIMQNMQNMQNIKRDNTSNDFK